MYGNETGVIILLTCNRKRSFRKTGVVLKRTGFFVFFLFFIFFCWFFSKSFVFRGEGGLLSSVFSSSSSLPHPRWSSLSLLFFHYLLFFLLPLLGGLYLFRRRGQSHKLRHRPALFLFLFSLFFLSLLCLFFSAPQSVDPGGYSEDPALIRT